MVQTSLKIRFNQLGNLSSILVKLPQIWDRRVANKRQLSVVDPGFPRWGTPTPEFLAKTIFAASLAPPLPSANEWCFDSAYLWLFASPRARCRSRSRWSTTAVSPCGTPAGSTGTARSYSYRTLLRFFTFVAFSTERPKFQKVKFKRRRLNFSEIECFSALSSKC